MAILPTGKRKYPHQLRTNGPGGFSAARVRHPNHASRSVLYRPRLRPPTPLRSAGGTGYLGGKRVPNLKWDKATTNARPTSPFVP